MEGLHHLAAASGDATGKMAGCIPLSDTIATVPHSSRGISRVTLQGRDEKISCIC